ncbi:MAG: uracil phosphoribosyltransferase [Myxococcota bacterium]|nr:uracil phosphoribosyltransferase [Myxococcota bacterium]
MRETVYRSYSYRPPQLEHRYGPNVHLLGDPVMLTQLARLSRPETLQPEVTWLVRDIYETLVRIVIAAEFPRSPAEVRTRMFAATPNGVWSGQILDAATKVVTVDVARAGTLPSQIAFETLVRLLNPDAVRQDHVYMNRVTNDAGAVQGVSVSGSKIGGGVDRAVVLFPDPMGATGGSMSWAMNMYKDMEGGTPMKLIALHLIVTPEYLKHMTTTHPDAIVYAVRLDRGMSEPDVLKTGLGERWSEERGLNEKQYIVPGAGGLGEILNNSYV